MGMVKYKKVITYSLEKSIISRSKSKLLDQVRSAIRTRHYSIRTEEVYVSWINYVRRNKIKSMGLMNVIISIIFIYGFMKHFLN